MIKGKFGIKWFREYWAMRETSKVKNRGFPVEIAGFYFGAAKKRTAKAVRGKSFENRIIVYTYS